MAKRAAVIWVPFTCLLILNSFFLSGTPVVYDEEHHDGTENENGSAENVANDDVDNEGGDNDVEHGEEDDEEEEEVNFVERQPVKDATAKAPRRAKAKAAGEVSTTDQAQDKIPISAEDVDMAELQNPAETYEVITYEDVKDDTAADEVKPKSRQSYAKKARLSIVGEFPSHPCCGFGSHILHSLSLW